MYSHLICGLFYGICYEIIITGLSTQTYDLISIWATFLRNYRAMNTHFYITLATVVTVTLVTLMFPNVLTMGSTIIGMGICIGIFFLVERFIDRKYRPYQVFGEPSPSTPYVDHQIDQYG